jgi:hypothetical protein
MIYIKIGGKRYALPVNPEELQVTHSNTDKTAEIAGLGEVLIPQKPALREISFSSFLPGYRSDPWVHGSASARSLAKALERAWKGRTKCRLIISRSIDYDTNMQCLISDLKFSDRGGEPDDLYYEVTFREYRSYGVSQMTVINSAGTAVTGPGAALMQGVEQGSKAILASVTAVREMDTPQMVVGASLVLNGTYYRTSAADLILGTASGETAPLTRIEQGTAAPYYVAGYGWLKTDAVSLVGVTS